MTVVAVLVVLLFLLSNFSVMFARPSAPSIKEQEYKPLNLTPNPLVRDASKPTNYDFFTSLTSYWLKLTKINANSSITIYMGFASNTTNLFNGVTVGEAPQLSNIYGEYDNGKNVFLYYTNFTNLNGWIANISNGSYSVKNGLSINFNGPGYVVTNSTYGPGTAFVAGITSIGDVDNVGYFNVSELVNNGQGWAGAFIRLACGNTYPDQWNASGEANGCGSAYGYFINKEGVPGTYLVEILNRTSSIQFLNGNFSTIINTNYPKYPAHVGFSGVYSSISVQWAAVMNMPPNGVMPTFNVSKQVYPSDATPNIKVPAGILYYVPIQIINNQAIPTPDEYQQLILVNSSAYLKYEAPNLENIEFFYANGTIIPSWLGSNNENTAGLIADLIIKVTPAYLSSVIINGQYMRVNSSGYLELKGLKPGIYSILAENPYRRWYFNNYTVIGGTNYINISLTPAYEYRGEGEQYPWIQVGPAYFPNPFNQQGTIYFNASGHIGLIQINPYDPNIIYIASGTEAHGLSGPIGDGGVYVTYNDGENWLPRNFGLPYGPICGLYMDPNNTNILLVSFTNNGIYRTDDGGLWWYRVSNITGANNFQRTGDKIFAGSDVGVIESDDDGLTWRTIYDSQNHVGIISVSGNTIYALIWGPGAPGIGVSYIYMIKSNDLGKSWELLHTFIGYYPMFISASPFNSSIVYLSYLGSKYTLFSNDGGISIMNTTLVPVKGIVFDPKNESIMWAYGPGIFYYSFDGGKSFKEGMPAVDQMGLAVYAGNGSMIVLGSDQGLYQSNDYGLTWRPINGDLSDTLTYSVSVGGNGSIIAVGMQDYSAFISIDGGKSWFGGNTQPIPIGGESVYIAVNPANASWLYAYRVSGELAVSDNSGLEFRNVVPGAPFYLLPPTALLVDPYNESNVFFAYDQGIYNGTEYGKMWSLWPNSPTNATTIAMPEQNVFLVGTTNGAYYNVNGTWLRSSGISGYVTSFAINPVNKNIVVAATGMFSTGSLYISYDYGKSFELLEEAFSNPEKGLLGIPIEVYWLNTSGYPLICATVDRGILVSLDQGRNWVPINYNLRSGEVTSVWFNNNNLYISTYGEGILVYPNFSIDNLPGTINGYTNVDNLNITINGQPINTYEGHFRVFLKPGNYTLSYLLNGVTKTITIDVKPMGTYNIFINARNYTISFTETGLPPGAQWSVSLNGTTRSSTSNTLTFNVPMGNYSYTVIPPKGYLASPSNGYVTVSTSNVTVAIVFSPQTYSVEFTEIGLPSGTPWSVTLNSTTKTSTSETLVFDVHAGTYSYTVTPPHGFVASPSSGIIDVASNITLSIKFSQIIYSVTFTETGLPSGISWSVTLGNITKSSMNRTITFTMPNGVYSYSVKSPITVNGIEYIAASPSGTVTVNNSNIEIQIIYKQALYNVSFVETGLPPGTIWYVNLSNGQSFKSMTNTITFTEPNGTYSYAITTENKNYAPSPSSGTFTVKGENVNITVTFSLITLTTTTLTTTLTTISTTTPVTTPTTTPTTTPKSTTPATTSTTIQTTITTPTTTSITASTTALSSIPTLTSPVPTGNTLLYAGIVTAIIIISGVLIFIMIRKK
jgi:photosystem II stability/assembly factor-like uncharacterized protein